MKIVGIIVEYNPFHNGHIYHIEQTRKVSNCDCLVAVMSGNFVQRGEPSSIDKFTKAELALNHGVDLVVELPTVYATQSADLFAYGAVQILNKLNVSEIYFGAENCDITRFNTAVEKLNSSEVQELIKLELDKGNSYPKSLANALNDDVFLTPNNTLGIQYLNAINKLVSNIKAYPIQRVHNNYHDEDVRHASIASATSIRKLVTSGESITSYVPNEIGNLNAIKTWYDYEPFLIYKLKSMTLEQLRNIHLVEEGLENKLFGLGKENISYDYLIEQLVSKRYTRSRINRTLLNILLNITKDEIKEINLLNPVNYVRILGMNNNGKKLLSLFDKTENKILTSYTDNDELMIDIELRCSKIYYYNSDEYMKEYKKPIIKG